MLQLDLVRSALRLQMQALVRKMIAKFVGQPLADRVSASKANDRNQWSEKWANNPEFLKPREKRAALFVQQFPNGLGKILDIGCGFAVETGLLQKQFSSELYLLDGDSNDSTGDRDINFGSSESMNFYLPIDYLQEQWRSRGLEYTFVDASNPVIDKDIKFDLIYSGKSCGFHYPLATYKNLFKAHSHADTAYLFDLRKDVDQGDIEFEILKVLEDGNKLSTCLLTMTF